ncbi:type II toxin-antitoxin system RelE/ParE family toxin [Planctomycetota bacterium]
MAELRWTEESAVWLEEIYQYISKDNPQAAARTIQSIYDRAQVLTEFPSIGHKYRDVPEGEVRILLFGHYRITYLIRSQQNIDILGVFHTALDIDRYL